MSVSPVRSLTAADPDQDGLLHTWCDCTGPLRAMCGVSLLDARQADDDDDEHPCVVCAHFVERPPCLPCREGWRQ